MGCGRQEFGPAARVGRLIQVTGIDIQKERLILILNGGMKNPKGAVDSWSHVDVSVGRPDAAGQAADTMRPPAPPCDSVQGRHR